MRNDPEGVNKLAQSQASRWENNPYYADAERYMAQHWEKLIYPVIKQADFSHVLELASGHGRNSEYLLQYADRLTLVDVLQDNIERCRKRFAGRDEKIHYIVNNGSSLVDVASSSISLVYCYDSMVHFHSDVVRSYLSEFKRILKPGGHAFLHHSNSTANPGGLVVQRHIQGRNFMSASMFAHYCILEGLEVVSQQIIDWGGSKELDCLSYLRA